MADIGIRIDTARSALGALDPFDIELSSLSLHCLGLISTRVFLAQADTQYFENAVSEDFLFRIKGISYTNPFDLWGTVKAIPKELVKAVLDRTLFYKQEHDRREYENDLLEQDVIARKLENLDKGTKLRAALIEGDYDPDQATKLVGSVLSGQKAELVPGNPKLLLPPPSKSNVRPPNGSPSRRKRR